METPDASPYMADLDIIRFCDENGFSVRTHPFFRDVEKFWPFVVCELRDAAVVGPHPTPVCQNRAFFDSLSNYGPRQKQRMIKHENDERQSIAVDKAVSIGGNPSFGHFIDVHLLQTLYLQLFDDLKSLPVITLGGMPQGSYDLLAALGIPESRLLKIDGSNAVVCKELYVPTTVGGVTPDFQSYSVPAKLCRLLRDLVRGAVLGTNAPTREPFRKVYIQRNNVTSKAVLNAEEVDAFMAGLGYELVDPAALSLAKQVKIAVETKYFVTPNGSQIHLADFAAAGTNLLFLTVEGSTKNPTWDAVERFGHLGMNFNAMLCPFDDLGNMDINIQQLHRGLQELNFPA